VAAYGRGTGATSTPLNGINETDDAVGSDSAACQATRNLQPGGAPKLLGDAPFERQAFRLLGPDLPQ
jgi:hypothetical protein